jgi:hypothetical protein
MQVEPGETETVTWKGPGELPWKESSDSSNDKSQVPIPVAGSTLLAMNKSVKLRRPLFLSECIVNPKLLENNSKNLLKIIGNFKLLVKLCLQNWVWWWPPVSLSYLEAKTGRLWVRGHPGQLRGYSLSKKYTCKWFLKSQVLVPYLPLNF